MNCEFLCQNFRNLLDDVEEGTLNDKKAAVKEFLNTNSTNLDTALEVINLECATRASDIEDFHTDGKEFLNWISNTDNLVALVGKSIDFETSMDSHSKVDYLSDLELEREEALRKKNYLFKYFKDNTYAQGLFILYTNDLLVNNVLKNTVTHKFVESKDELNQQIKYLFNKNLENIKLYLSKVYSADYNQLSNSTIFNNNQLNSDIKGLIDVLDNIFTKEYNFGDNFLKNIQDVDKDKVNAYFSYVAIKSFDDVLKDKFGKAIQIPKGLFNKFDYRKLYDLLGINNMGSGWRNAEDENDLNEICTMDRTLVESIPLIENGTPTLSKLNFSLFNLAMMALWKESRNYKEKSKPFLPIINNATGQNNYRKQLNSGGSTYVLNNLDIYETFAPYYGELKLTELLHQLIERDGTPRSISEVIPMINANTIDFAPLVVWLSLALQVNNEDLLDVTSTFGSPYNTSNMGDFLFNLFSPIQRNILNSIWEGVFNPNNSESLINYANQNKNGEIVFNPNTKHNYYLYITLMIQSLEANKFMEYLYDSEEGKIVLVSLEDGEANLRLKSLQSSIEARNSIISRLDYDLNKNGVYIDNNFNLRAVTPTITIEANGLDLKIFIDKDSNVKVQIGDSKYDIKKDSILLGKKQDELFDKAKPFLANVFPRNIINNDKFITLYKTKELYNWASNLIKVASSIVYTREVNKYIHKLYNEDPSKIFTELKSQKKRAGLSTSNEVVIGEDGKEIVLEEVPSLLSGSNYLIAADGILELKVAGKNLYGPLLEISGVIDLADGHIGEGMVRDGHGNSISQAKLSQASTKEESLFERKSKNFNAAARDFSLYNAYEGVEFMRDYLDEAGNVYDIKSDLTPQEFFTSNFAVDIYGLLVPNKNNKQQTSRLRIAGPVISDKPSVARLVINTNLVLGGKTIKDIMLSKADSLTILRNAIRDELGTYYNNIYDKVQSTYDYVNNYLSSIYPPLTPEEKLLHPDWVDFTEADHLKLSDNCAGFNNWINGKFKIKDLLHEILVYAQENGDNFKFIDNVCGVIKSGKLHANPILIDLVIRLNATEKHLPVTDEFGGTYTLQEIIDTQGDIGDFNVSYDGIEYENAKALYENIPNLKSKGQKVLESLSPEFKNLYWGDVTDLNEYTQKYFTALLDLLISDLIVDDTIMSLDLNKKKIFSALKSVEGLNWTTSNNNLAYAKILTEDSEVLLDSKNSLELYFLPYKNVLWFAEHGLISSDLAAKLLTENAEFSIGELINFINSTQYSSALVRKLDISYFNKWKKAHMQELVDNIADELDKSFDNYGMASEEMNFLLESILSGETTMIEILSKGYSSFYAGGIGVAADFDLLDEYELDLYDLPSNVNYTLQINPAYDNYNLLTYLYNQEFINSTLGSHINHPAKILLDKKGNPTGTLREIEAEMFGQQTKRNVTYTAAKHKYNTSSLNGILPEIKIAIVDDISNVCYNINGSLANVSVHDGATFVHGAMQILENNSLEGSAVGVDKKQFGHDYNEETGTGFILKTAGFAVNNARIRDSEMYERLNRRMGSLPWKPEGTVTNFLQDYNGNPILITSTDADGNVIDGFYRYNPENKLFEHVSLLEIDTDGNVRAIVELINPKDPLQVVNSYDKLLIWDASVNGPINNTYQLWNLFGGAYSASYILEESNSLKVPILSYMLDNSSFENVVKIMNLVGDVKPGRTSITSNNDVDLFIKRALIAYVPTAGAVKLGASNVNAWEDFLNTDDYDTTYTTMSTDDLGVQLDAEHHADDSVLSLMTLVVNALGARGYDYRLALDTYEALESITNLALKDCFEGFDEMMNKQDSEKLRNAITKTIAKTLSKASSTDGALLTAISQDLSTCVTDLLKANYLNSLPLDSPDIFGKIVSNVASALTKSSVKKKFPGLMAVLTPSDGAIKLYNMKYTDEDGEVVDEPVLRSELGATLDEINAVLQEKLQEIENDINEYGISSSYVAATPSELTLDRTYKILPTDLLLSPTDRIIFGSPGLGKSYAVENNYNILDFDDVYNHLRDEYIQNKTGVSKYLADGITVNPDWQEAKVSVLSDHSDVLLRQLLDDTWEIAKELAVAQGKILTASTNDLLYTHADDFDKFLIADTQTLDERRPGLSTSDWWNASIAQLVDRGLNVSVVPYGTNFTDILDASLDLSNLLINVKDPGIYYKLKDYYNKGFIDYLWEDITTGYDLGNTLFNIQSAEADENVYNVYDLDSVRNKWFAKTLEERELYLAQIQEDLNTMATGGIVKIDGNDVNVKPVEMTPYDIIAPKNYKTEFGLRTDDLLSEILKDPYFFAIRTLENYGDHTLNYDICLKGIANHKYLLYKGLDTYVPDTLQKTDFDYTIEDDVCYRVDADGNRLYKIPTINGEPDFELYTDIDTGQEVIRTSNIVFFLDDSDYYSSIRVGNRVSGFSAEDLTGLFTEISKSDKKPAQSVMYVLTEIETGETDEDGNPVKASFYNPEDPSWIDLVYWNYDLLCNRITNITSAQKVDIPQALRDMRSGQAPRRKTKFINNIIEDGIKMHTSFLKSLEIVASRTPAQSMQSFMSMKIKAFDNSDINSAYVSRWQLYLLGSDYDIDKVNLLGKKFKNGKFISWSPLYNLNSLELANASDNLPFPTGKSLDDVSNESGESMLELANLYNTLDTRTVEGIINISDFIKKINTGNYVNDLTDSKLVKLINKHNLYFSDKKNQETGLVNFITTKMYKVTLNPLNSIQAQTSIDEPVDIVKSLAKELLLAKKSKRFDTKSITSLFNLLCLTLEGKLNVGIVASALKVFEAMSLYYYKTLHEGTPEQKDALTFKARLADKEYNVIANAYANPKAVDLLLLTNPEIASYLNNVNLYEDAFVKFSALLSLATDNAKDPTLSKIKATSKLILLYDAGIALGATFDDLVHIISSKSGELVNNMLLRNKFNNGTQADFKIGLAISKLLEGPTQYSDLKSIAFPIIKLAIQFIYGDIPEKITLETLLNYFGKLKSTNIQTYKAKQLLTLLKSIANDYSGQELPVLTDTDIAYNNLKDILLSNPNYNFRYSLSDFGEDYKTSALEVLENADLYGKEVLDYHIEQMQLVNFKMSSLQYNSDKESKARYKKLKKLYNKLVSTTQKLLERNSARETYEKYYDFYRNLIDDPDSVKADPRYLEILKFLENVSKNRELLSALRAKTLEEAKDTLSGANKLDEGLNKTLTSLFNIKALGKARGLLKDFCNRLELYIKNLDILKSEYTELDLVGSDGSTYKRKRYTIEDIKLLSECAEEMAALNSKLKLNQGMPNNLLDLLAWVRTFEHVISDRLDSMLYKNSDLIDSFVNLNSRFLSQHLGKVPFENTEVNFEHYINNTPMDSGIGYRDFVTEFYDLIKAFINPLRVIQEVPHFRGYVNTMGMLYAGLKSKFETYNKVDEFSKVDTKGNSLKSKLKILDSVKGLLKFIHFLFTLAATNGEFGDFRFKSNYVIRNGLVILDDTLEEPLTYNLHNENGRRIFKETMNNIVFPYIIDVYGKTNGFAQHLDTVKYTNPNTKQTEIVYTISGINTRPESDFDKAEFSKVTDGLKSLAGLGISGSSVLDLIYLYNLVAHNEESTKVSLTPYFLEIGVRNISSLISAHKMFKALFLNDLEFEHGIDYTEEMIYKAGAPVLNLLELENFKGLYAWVKDPLDNLTKLVRKVRKAKEDPNSPEYGMEMYPEDVGLDLDGYEEQSRRVYSLSATLDRINYNNPNFDYIIDSNFKLIKDTNIVDLSEDNSAPNNKSKVLIFNVDGDELRLYTSKKKIVGVFKNGTEVKIDKSWKLSTNDIFGFSFKEDGDSVKLVNDFGLYTVDLDNNIHINKDLFNSCIDKFSNPKPC